MNEVYYYHTLSNYRTVPVTHPIVSWYHNSLRDLMLTNANGAKQQYMTTDSEDYYHIISLHGHPGHCSLSSFVSVV